MLRKRITKKVRKKAVKRKVRKKAVKRKGTANGKSVSTEKQRDAVAATRQRTRFKQTDPEEVTSIDALATSLRRVEVKALMIALPTAESQHRSRRVLERIAKKRGVSLGDLERALSKRLRQDSKK